MEGYSMKKLALLLLALAAPAFAQRCTTHVGVSTTSAGYTQIVAAPPAGNGNIHICALYTSITQSATPANFQIKGCTEITCTTSPVSDMSPLWTGHASFLDTYNLNANQDVMVPALNGQGVYLYLSSAPTAAQVQVFYAIF
jgi:hypothetical protein